VTARAPVPRSAPVGVPREPTMREKVRNAKISAVSFTAENGDFTSVVRHVRTVTGIPILMTPAARGVVDGEGLVLDLDVRAPITVANLLDVMAGRSEELRWGIRDGVVFLEAKADGGSHLSLEYYDVRDLTFARTEFIAPKLGGLPTGNEEGPRSGGEGEEKTFAFDTETMVETIRLATDPKFWESEPEASIELADTGMLIVRATPAIHGRIRRLLGI
jgi:hypothetical protein